MAKNRKNNGLGLGLDALFSGSFGDDAPEETEGIKTVRTSEIEPDEKQPRKNFDAEKLAELTESVRSYGVIQPLIVRRDGNAYKIVAGERRWRAARAAGLETVPVIERELTPRETVEISIIENIQRENLNPIEEAEAFSRLMTEFGLTQEALSNVVAKSRADIANSVRLLSLSDEIKEMISDGRLTKGHGKALLALNPSIDMTKVAETVAEQNLNVRQTENLVKRYNALKPSGAALKEANSADEYIIAKKDVEARLKARLGAKVTLIEKEKNGKGRLQISYSSSDERERLIALLLNQTE